MGKAMRLMAFFLLGCQTLFLAAQQGNAGGVRHISQAEFLEQVAHFDSEGALVCTAARPTLVDFYADWCGPCRKLSPILNELAKEHTEVDFCKINVDEAQELAAVIGASSIPLVIMFVKDQQPQGFTGLYPKEIIEKFITATVPH